MYVSEMIIRMETALDSVMLHRISADEYEIRRSRWNSSDRSTIETLSAAEAFQAAITLAADNARGVSEMFPAAWPAGVQETGTHIDVTWHFAGGVYTQRVIMKVP